MSDAGELVVAAGAAIVVPTQTSGLHAFDAEAVTTLGQRPEERHNRAPFAPMGRYAGTEQAEGHDVGRFVRNRLREELAWMAQQQLRIVADRAAAYACESDLACALPVQIESDPWRRQLDSEVP